VYCSVCKRETSPISIGADSYCSVCGTAYAKPKGSGTTQLKPAGSLGRAPIDMRPGATPTTSTPVNMRSEVAQAKIDDAAIHHAPNHTAMHAPSSAQHSERHLHQFSDRFERARGMSRSAQISRFGTDRFGNIQDPSKMYDKFGNPTLQTLQQQGSEFNKYSDAARSASHSNLSPHNPVTSPHLPNVTTTQHEAMAKLPYHAPTSAPAPRPALSMPRAPLSPAAGRVMAIVAALVVMGGYIWAQNYPKLAIQNAGDRAGISASMPSYVPSSYSLAHTATQPGQVTLKFTSPSASEALQISQQRTTWDSSSLLDNFISKSSDDYAAVQGQGLTIYFWGQNQAAWVNHGIWYSIEGATRLSREQVLKIAYSL
jgi:Domain of unknown function (DUF4367)